MRNLARLFRVLLAALALSAVLARRAALLVLAALLVGWIAVDRHALPGVNRRDPRSLHPALRVQVEALRADLAARGWQVGIASGWRSPERQEALYRLSQAAEALGQPPSTRARGGRSCHNQVAADGSPAAAAVDLVPVGVRDLDRRAAFYRDLGRAAHRRGLRWGGDFRQRNPVWARYDLGWDPAHVEDADVCRALRDRRPAASTGFP